MQFLNLLEKIASQLNEQNLENFCHLVENLVDLSNNVLEHQGLISDNQVSDSHHE